MEVISYPIAIGLDCRKCHKTISDDDFGRCWVFEMVFCSPACAAMYGVEVFPEYAEKEKELALDRLVKMNEWRNGLSQSEQSCFEAGWDAALEGQKQWK